MGITLNLMTLLTEQLQENNVISNALQLEKTGFGRTKAVGLLNFLFENGYQCAG